VYERQEEGRCSFQELALRSQAADAPDWPLALAQNLPVHVLDQLAELRKRRAVDGVSPLPRLELARFSSVPRCFGTAPLEDVVIGSDEGLTAEDVMDSRKLRAEAKVMLPRMPVPRKRDAELPTALEHTMALRQCGFDVLDVLEDVEREDRVEALVGEGERLSAPDMEVGCDILGLRELGGGVDVHLCDVDAGEMRKAIPLAPGDASSSVEATQVESIRTLDEPRQIRLEVVVPGIRELVAVAGLRGPQHDPPTLVRGSVEEARVVKDFLEAPDVDVGRDRRSLESPHQESREGNGVHGFSVFRAVPGLRKTGKSTVDVNIEEAVELEDVHRLNVLHVINSFVDLSISRIILRLIDNLGSRTISWHVGAVSSPGDMQSAFERLGCRVIDFTDTGTASPRRSIRRYIREHNVDIVHTHTPRTIVDVSLALLGIDHVTHVATKHLLNAPGDRRWGVAYALLDRLTLYPPDVLVPVSSTMRDQIISQPFIDQGKVVLIRNAIPIENSRRPDDRAEARSEFGLAADASVLGYAGRIDKVKRIDLLLKAFKQVYEERSQARLVIAGEGGLRAEMEALAAALGISHAVRWLGFQRNMPRLLAGIDVYVQSSVNEGLSLSILEAMAAEKAVVATNVGAAKEVIADGETGLLVSPGSATAIAAAVIELLGDPERRAAISRAARAHVESEFDLGKMVEKYAAVYARLAEEETRTT
jgi:glycosyltransferase involved in cell wall biosynthesis